MTDSKLTSADYIQLTKDYSTLNYAPLDIVLCEGKGVWVKDVDGNKYIDMLSAYSAMNFGHCNTRITAAAKSQLDKITLVSRAFDNEQFALLCKELCEFSGMQKALIMNSGAEAVESSIKIVRKWGYEKKKVEADKAEIICFSGNFHGRTTTVISFSDSALSRKNFGPLTPGFKIAEYGNIESVKSLVTKNTVGILVEPIQGEGGIIIPPEGFLIDLRELSDKNNIAMIADEIQTGMCRTGKLFACDYENVKPDVYLLGKSLGGGIVPISAVLGKTEIMDVLEPGTHGSTFGGNSFASAVAREVIALINEEKPQQKVVASGEYMMERLRAIKSTKIMAVRGRGLLIGVDIDKAQAKVKDICYQLKNEGVLCKDTREQTLRFAPPLTIERDELDWALERIEKVLRD